MDVKETITEAALLEVLAELTVEVFVSALMVPD